VLANLLICAVGNFTEGDHAFTVCTDPNGGDGLIYKQRDGKYMTTEHVFVPPKGRAETEQRIVGAVQHKAKKGAAYARGKHLVIFSEATGEWKPNRAARRIAGTHEFESVWVVHLEQADAGVYSYSIAWLDLSRGHAPIARVTIADDFKGWRVERIQ
jgi:hypothetical protein